MSPSHPIEDLNFMVSLYCPGRCAHCGLWKEKRSEIIEGELDVEMTGRFLRSEALRQVGYFDLTAGESQLSPNYTKTVELIAASHPGSFIHTNISGWYPKTHLEVTRKCVDLFNPQRFRLDISIDGRPENYRRIRQVRDGWQKAMKTIECLRSLGCILRLVFIVHRENYDDVRWFVRFAEELELDYYIGYSRRSALLRNTDQPGPGYTAEQLENLEQTLQEIGWLMGRRKDHWLWAKQVYQGTPPRFHCLMGRRSLVIDPFGGVFPCNELLPQLRMGGLIDFDGDLDALLASAQAQEVCDKVAAARCQPCDMLCAHKIVFPWNSDQGGAV